MNTLPTKWKPAPVNAVAELCGSFKGWVLCGGHSVALIVGKDTRGHSDIDIGVFRSQAEQCLEAIGREQVFLCVGGKHVTWDGQKVPESVHHIWVADAKREHWILQVMLYDDVGDRVFYRRDREISWSKAVHSITIEGIPVLNPWITFLFMTNKKALDEKERHDVMLLIEHAAGGTGGKSEA